MIPDPRKLAIAEHLRWLGYLQPEGLFVSPLALVDSQVQLDTGGYAAAQERFLDAVSRDSESGAPIVDDFARMARAFLGWKDQLLDIWSVSAEVPDALRIATGEHGEILQPSAAYRHFQPADPAHPWLLLLQQLTLGTDLDAAPDGKGEKGWIASPHQKFERLLRETKVPIGVLCNGHEIRLVYAPKGENSGWLTFPIGFMAQLPGRVLPSALELLLSHQRLIVVPEAVRLPALLRKSRDYQAEVSTALSHQVLEALFELGRGFQAADERSRGTLLEAAWARDPQEIYGGLITTLLRLVFLLYAEDRGLMPTGDLYQQGYSVQGLFDRLRVDAERYPDTMDERFGAWPRLLALFRAVYSGCKHRKMSLPARKGHLFDPDRFPFLEGRRDKGDAPGENLPRLSDGTLHRILHLLLYLHGERLSYRTLDVEQIGSVYETIMGFHVEKAPGRMIALKPRKAHGAPIHLSLDDLLAAKPADRAKLVLDRADTKLPAAPAKALKDAATHDDLLAALEKRIDRRATPHPVPAGSILLQPTDERRRSGSHYTPRSFTEPIVRKTLEPILDRLGRHPQPEAILDLKIADIAVGSAAFLVETCRQLADELVSSWHFHKSLPVIPPDEDELLYARRLVAQRCLYGVDRNPMAVDLAKLSLWLATMARDHPFTFLDHAIKCGDSLVGLTNRQIAAFHWDPAQAAQRVMGQDQMENLIERVTARRKEIIADPEDTEYAILRKQSRLAEADAHAQTIKTTGDLAIAAFFAGSKPKERQQHRDDFLEKHLALQRGQNVQENLPWEVRTLHQLRSGEHPIRPFHWEIEFPEVFSRENPGFDGIVGNPPFLGGARIWPALGPQYPDWLRTVHENSDGKGVDLAAHFYRRAFDILNPDACFGLIASKTISQGNTRLAGLREISLRGGKIYSAIRRIRWPGEAAVIVSIIHVSKSPLQGVAHLDEKQVPGINSFLFPQSEEYEVTKLSSNSEMSFRGSDTYGAGFIFSSEPTDKNAGTIDDMKALIDADSINAEVILPFIGGQELATSPTHTHYRYAINFAKRPLEECDRWPALLNIVKEKVKPERDLLKGYSVAEKRREYWWQYGTYAAALYRSIAGQERVLAISQTTSYIAFAFLPARMLFSHKLIVFPAKSGYSDFAVLQSRNHKIWALFWGSSLGDTPFYSPPDCLDTFPFPSDWEENAALEEAGKTYYEYRAELMVRNDEGLTKTYNRFHDPDERSPDILRLRELHAAMDRAVLDAYGWTDIPTDCQFLLDYEEDEDDEPTGKKRQKKKPWRHRWPDEVRDEVLARLLALNAERHQEEVRLGIAPGMKKAKTSTEMNSAREHDQREKREDELL